MDRLFLMEKMILRYLVGMAAEKQNMGDFLAINNASNLNWSFRSQVAKFIKRFRKDPYRTGERKWIQTLACKYGISIKKLTMLSKII